MNSRRRFLRRGLEGAGALLLERFFLRTAEARKLRTVALTSDAISDLVPERNRFPHFQSVPVSWRNVIMRDRFWKPRQRSTRDVSVSWITRAHDDTGGLDAFKAEPETYIASKSVLNMEAIKFIEAMATIVGVQRDRDIEGLIDAWTKPLIQAQAADGYLEERFPPGLDHPTHRWQPVWWSHESYTTGHYIEAAIAYKDATGASMMYESAVRAADNMVTQLLDSERAYTSGHPEIEQALMRLYNETGSRKYLRLCGWLLDQRGNHIGRPSFGWMRLDEIPIRAQREISGHAVMAAYLFNGVTHYVGATGDPAYREAVLSVWNDFVTRKMYIHGGGGNQSSKIEGYRREPYCIPPDDAYCESCSVVANFQWAHSLFRLTGDATYLDVADRMLYNAFYASLSLRGDASFYSNLAQADVPTPRSPALATSCCPPNIVKLFNKIGGFFYSTDSVGIYVNHFGSSKADIPFGGGVTITQQTEYPWDGAITLLIETNRPQAFALRLRVPNWARSNYALFVNGKPVKSDIRKGWAVVQRYWRTGDRVNLNLPMYIQRVTLPPEFKEYENRAALERGPVVYCLEELDLAQPQGKPGDDVPGVATVYIPETAMFEVEYRANLLGGVNVLKGEVRQLHWADNTDLPVQATFVPYGVWDNRDPGPMRIWLGARKAPLVEMLLPEQDVGESCAG